MEIQRNTRQSFGSKLSQSITLKIFIVGVLILILLIPLNFVQDLVGERKERQREVIEEINSKWGKEVILSGPILKIPYISTRWVIDDKGQEQVIQRETKDIYLLPDELNIDAHADAKSLKRSIYQSVVYSSDISVKGSFAPIKLKADIDPEYILWDKAKIIIQSSNLKGIKNTIVTKLGDRDLQMAPIYSTNLGLNTIESDIISDLEHDGTTPISFQFDIKINGSGSLEFIPLGKTTNASMSSNWASPSFDGMFLPNDETKEISKDGFKASWTVLQMNRQFEQEFVNELPYLPEFAFGTKLLVPVNEYAKSERASKYGLLVIALTLLVFLLIQLVSKIYIHPFQYIMIGLALVMFYTLLISISEQSSFLLAYFLASISVIALIGAYSKTILKKMKFSLFVIATLLCLYGFIYIIIQMEDYAMLSGSIGLFVILAAVMFFSKNIDWNNKQETN
ncbi:MAG: cell envelope integrity protein CreD [Bacteroidales bacterium]